MNRVLVVIPAYNEEENIERVVDELIAGYPELDYLVINDGSKDRTAEICRSRGYHLLDLPVNLGLAGCFQAGMKYACRKGYRYAIQFDGDGQHRPEYIESSLKTSLPANPERWIALLPVTAVLSLEPPLITK